MHHMEGSSDSKPTPSDRFHFEYDLYAKRYFLQSFGEQNEVQQPFAVHYARQHDTLIKLKISHVNFALFK